jgi:hypothetical protein
MEKMEVKIEDELCIRGLLAIFCADVDIFLLKEEDQLTDRQGVYTKEDIRYRLKDSMETLCKLLNHIGYDVTEALHRNICLNPITELAARQILRAGGDGVKRVCITMDEYNGLIKFRNLGVEQMAKQAKELQDHKMLVTNLSREYNAMRDELMSGEKEAGYVQKIDSLKEHMAELRKLAKGYLKQLAKERETITELRGAIEDARTKMKGANDLGRQLGRLASENATLQQDLIYAREDIEKATVWGKDKIAEINVLNAKIVNMQSDREWHQKENDKLRKSKYELQKQMNSVVTELETKGKTISDALDIERMRVNGKQIEINQLLAVDRDVASLQKDVKRFAEELLRIKKMNCLQFIRIIIYV